MSSVKEVSAVPGGFKEERNGGRLPRYEGLEKYISHRTEAFNGNMRLVQCTRRS